MHYHRNHLSPPLENQPNISRTVLAKCFWEMFNVSSFRRQTIPFISVQFWSHEECRRRPFLVDCDKRKCFDLRFLWSENCRSNNSNSYFLGSVDVDDCYARRRVLVTLKCLDNGKQWRALRSPQVLYYKPSLHSALEAALIGGPSEQGGGTPFDTLVTGLASTARLLLIWRIPQNMELMDRRLDSIRTTAAAQIRYLAIVRLNHGNGIVLNHRSQSSDGLTHSNTVLQ